MKEILHINSYYAAGKFYKNLYDEQVKQGQSIKVFVPVAKGSKVDSKLYGDYTEISANYNKRDRFFFHLKQGKIFRDALDRYGKESFQLIHAHSLFTNGYVAYLLSKKWGIPYIVAVRNSDVNVFFLYMLHLRKLGCHLLNNASKIVFLSPSYRDFVINTYVSENDKKAIWAKSIVIPNGIDNFWFENLHEKKAFNSQKTIRLLTVGDICKNKNQITVCKACEILKKQGIKISYSLVGPIKDKEFFSEIGSYDFIQYFGKLPKEELLKIYEESDIFILTSLTETFGLVYAEAMSQGLPLIYSKGQGFDRQFEEGVVGYHVDSNNPMEVSQRLKDVINDYDMLSENCLKQVKKFSWDLLAQEYIGIM